MTHATWTFLNAFGLVGALAGLILIALLALVLVALFRRLTR